MSNGSIIIVSIALDERYHANWAQASLALWAGGNELESLILQNIVKSKVPEQYDRFVGEFERLFIDVLAPAVFSNSHSISYTPSSTGRGWLTLDFDSDPLKPFTERYLNVTNGSIYGDTE